MAAAVLATAGLAHAAKVTVDKPTEEPQRGSAPKWQAVDLAPIVAAGASLIAEYPTFYLLDVPATAMLQIAEAIANVHATAWTHPELDVFSVNGHEFRLGSEPPVLRLDLQLADYPGPVGLYLAQMVGPNRSEWQDALRGAGDVVAYYPEGAFLIRARPDAIKHLKGHAAFQYVGVYQPALKIRADLLDFVGVMPVVVVLDGGQDLSSIHAMLDSLAAGAISSEEEGPYRTPVLYLTAAEVKALAFQAEVLWLEPASQPRVSDERQALVLAGQNDGVKPTNPESYDDWLSAKGFCTSESAPVGCYSATANVAVFDTGLDKNICNSSDPTCPTFDAGNKVAHPDLALREARFYCANRSGTNGCYGFGCGAGCTKYNYSDVFGHGTAVASIIAGDPLRPGYGVHATTGHGRDKANFYLGSGIAPMASVIAFRVFPTGNSWFYLPGSDYYGPSDWQNWYGQLPADTRFANMSTNDYYGVEYGGYGAGAYNTWSQKMDELVRDSNGGFNDLNHPMTVSVSAGNYDPPDLSFEGVLAPANAKNVISVGAAQSYRKCAVGPCTFDIEPFQSDPCKAAESIKNIAAFSNRGYAGETNRFKPDVVAPSTRVGAAWSRAEPDGYGCIKKPTVGGDENDRFYTRFWGTSGSAPVATGAAVLVDEWYYRHSNPQARPSPAMVKALLAAHADDLYGGLDERTGQTISRSPAMPQGWGRINLDRIFQTSVSTMVFDEDHATTPTRRFRPGDASWSANVLVSDPSKDVLVALTWTDRAAVPNAGNLAVNRLAAYVHDGSYHYTSNTWDSNRYTPRRTVLSLPDGHNTIQLIRIHAGEIANNDFTVEVKPHAVNQQAVPTLDGGSANQDFALYVYNGHS